MLRQLGDFPRRDTRNAARPLPQCGAMCPINPAGSPDSVHWDGSGRLGRGFRRALRLHPATRTRLLRAAQRKPCPRCGNLLEWYYRDDGRPIALHPGELPITRVPEEHRWHVLEGIALPGADGTPWCRLPHSALCPAAARATTATHPLDKLRRQLAVNTRRLLDTHSFTPSIASAPPPVTDVPASDRRRDVAQLFHTLYLAPGSVEEMPCVSLTIRRTRCPYSLTRQARDLGMWTTVSVPSGRHRGRQRELTDHLTSTAMAVYDLSHLPYLSQLRWRAQHCPVHAASPAADIALTIWEPFDAFAHHQHITPTIPRTGPSMGERPC
jgi:hypothetical protein